MLPSVLILAGFWLLYQVSGTVATPLALLAVALVSYALAASMAHSSAPGPTVRDRVRRLTQRAAVPVALAALLLLNLSGQIGTLTGSRHDGGNAALLIAAPFYGLAAGAFLADIAGGKLALPTFAEYLLYLALPFRLLAGPIEPPRLITQARRRLQLRWRYLTRGLPWIWLGLFLKYVIANRLDPASRLALTDPVNSLLTAAVFELKFYFDFAGYSFIAYGLALLVNLRLTLNFTHPFFSRSVVVFWHHWHVSLGRFLSRYLLDPNLKSFVTRPAKLRFASSIFLASALWHGGTFNYLLWGLFHGGCYYGYIRFVKTRAVHAATGVVAMLAFFVLGRFLAIEADGARLLHKLAALIDPAAWAQSCARAWHQPAALLPLNEALAVVVALLFLATEGLSLHWYGRQRPYHLHRRPWVSFGLLTGFVVFGIDTANLLYARL